MLDATNTITGDPDITVGSNGYLVPFQANATGLFSTPAVPEPTTAALVGALGHGNARSPPPHSSCIINTVSERTAGAMKTQRARFLFDFKSRTYMRGSFAFT